MAPSISAEVWLPGMLQMMFASFPGVQLLYNYHPVIKHGWKIPLIYFPIHSKCLVIYIYIRDFPAMFDYQRVSILSNHSRVSISIACQRRKTWQAASNVPSVVGKPGRFSQMAVGVRR